MRLVLIRHGESEGNAGRIFQGRQDFGLTPLGLRQAELTGVRLQELEPDRVVTSPLRRASDTAGRIAATLGVEAQTDEALLEYDVGAISGLTVPEVREQFPELIESWRARGKRPPLPGEEGRAPFYERVSGFIEGLDWTAEGTTVAVTHGGVVNAACHIALGIDFPDFFGRSLSFGVGNCSITEFRSDHVGRPVLVAQNDSCHLEGLAG